MIRAVSVPGAPKPVGPYSPAIVHGGLVYASGQIGLDPQTGLPAEGGIEAQTRRALESLRGVVEAAGSSMSRALKATVYLKSMEDFARMNGVYAEFFPQTPPARTTIQIGALPKDALVEIDLIAALP
ncbi:MAG: reactive intermediate/imine deaminase [Bryobacterales bacterium]|nr:reactive intermediate/imine deaminase [Bryobacterales bacterium]